MKVGLRPKKFFYDIILLPQKEIKRQRSLIEKHQKNKVIFKKPLVLDALIPEDKIKKRITELWHKRRLSKNKKKLQTIAEAAESVLGRSQIESGPRKKLRLKTFFKNSLVLF